LNEFKLYNKIYEHKLNINNNWIKILLIKKKQIDGHEIDHQDEKLLDSLMNVYNELLSLEDETYDKLRSNNNLNEKENLLYQHLDNKNNSQEYNKYMELKNKVYNKQYLSPNELDSY